MLMKSVFFLLLVAVFQVYAGNVEPDFIENVMKRESESTSASRIVSGWPARPGQHPHQAALRMVDPFGNVGGCGGSFVSKEWVITSAHCTAGRVTVVVRGGVVSLTNPEYIFETTEYYNHPTFDNNKPLVVQTNDISLLKLQRPVVYTRLLKSIRIQSSADAYKNYDGVKLYTSGHGRTWTDGPVTETLNWVYLTGVSNAACAQLYGSALIVGSTICAKFYNVTSQSVCQGDSGGPLVHVESDGVPTLIGVTSFVAGGNFGCHSGLPAGFIRPGPFHSWFKQVTGLDFENLNEDEDDGDDPESPEGGEGEEEEEEGEEEEGEGEGEEEDDSDSSESDEDCEMSELMKRLEVKVKVKVRLNKYKVKKEVEKEKEIRKHH